MKKSNENIITWLIKTNEDHPNMNAFDWLIAEMQYKDQRFQNTILLKGYIDPDKTTWFPAFDMDQPTGFLVDDNYGPLTEAERVDWIISNGGNTEDKVAVIPFN